ncbi:MAG: hypothetical protein QOF77_2077 [Solirubrobacteraceae bacterium]|jgi:hypothetical protein|nr:hypothetical protein [Solirubrobacteraceae bacterium]
MSENQRAVRVDEEIRATLHDSGAVNFEAIGATLAKFGPVLAQGATLEGEDGFCGVFRYYTRVFHLTGPLGNPGGPVESLAEVATELRGA